MASIALVPGSSPYLPVFTDPFSRIRFEAHEPASSPYRWAQYLAGLEERYSRHGVQRALDRASLQDGSTSLFFIAIDASGEPVGGLRCRGPLRSARDARVLTEFAGSPYVPNIQRLLSAHLSLGIVEVKGCWVSTKGESPPVSSGLSRCYVHAMDLLHARFACCSAASHAVGRWETSGGRVVQDVGPVAYPDPRYQTVMVWWDRKLVDRLAERGQRERIGREARQLVGEPAPVPALCPT